MEIYLYWWWWYRVLQCNWQLNCTQLHHQPLTHDYSASARRSDAKITQYYRWAHKKWILSESLPKPLAAAHSSPYARFMHSACDFRTDLRFDGLNSILRLTRLVEGLSCVVFIDILLMCPSQLWCVIGNRNNNIINRVMARWAVVFSGWIVLVEVEV